MSEKSKGVICHIFRDEDAPTDMAGNRADVIKFARTAVARLNPGQLYEQYITASARDMSKWVANNYGTLDLLSIWDFVLLYYHKAAPKQYEILTAEYTTPEQIDAHIRSIVESGIYLYIPADSEHLRPEIFNDIEAIMPPTYGPVTYRDLNGNMVTTHDKAFIGIQQIIVLEKSDLHPMAVSSSTLQHHGIISGPNKASRQGHGAKVQATKVMSETEVRMWAALIGPWFIAAILNLANSPESHKEVVKQIMEAPQPTNIAKFKNIHKGQSRPLQFITHVFMGFGVLFRKVFRRK